MEENRAVVGDEQYQQYQQYWEEMPCYLTMHDRDFRITNGNRRFREDFGESIGEFCYRVFKRREDICPDCPVDATFREEVGQGSEQMLISKRGEYIPVMVHTTPIRNGNGEVVSVMEMHTEIKEVKRLQGLLQRSQARLLQLFEEVPCMISVQSPNRVIEHANRKFRETFGPSVGEACYKVYKHRDEQCLVCPTQQTFSDGQTREHEEVLVTASGEKINVLCTTAPLRNAAGEIESVIEMCIDITQIRQLQSQLASIGLLVGSISHGIKGLLTGLDGGIYMVNSGFEKNKPERVSKGWEMVQRNVDRIRSMVLDILYYAKDRELTVVDIDPAEVVGEIQEVINKKACDFDITTEFEVAADAGNFPGDASAIRAMLLNIIENSIDACRADRGKNNHRVKLKAHRSPPWMVFDIADTGIGMDRETRERIFSLFFSSKGIKGTGLGLFISNKIVDKHGGTIDVESEPGEGARFVIRLPLAARPSTRPDEE
jgi:PAS domain S-box-containing protein